MGLRISGKHMNVGEALTSRIEDRLEEAVTKYFPGGYDGHVTLEKQGSRFACDCVIHLDSSADLQGTASETDPTAAFETAADKIEKRLRRYKRKLKDHHSHNGNGREAFEAASYVLASTEDDEELPADFNPLVIAETSAKVKTMTVGMAVMELDLTEAPVVMFKNAANGGVNVVYRRPDGNIGWIDPALVAGEAAE